MLYVLLLCTTEYSVYIEEAMEDAQERAASSLSEIAVIERRTKAALAYRRASAFFILWGVLVTIGAGLNQVFPDRSQVIWYGIDAIGVLGTCAIAFYRARASAERASWRIITSFLVLTAYGVAWSYLLAPAGHDRLAVFWSTLMMGYVVAGVWQGPLFMILGLTGTAFSFAAFVFAGPWLHVWIGAVHAVAFVLVGLRLHGLGAGD